MKKKTCSIENCGEHWRIIKGFCDKHYQRLKIHGDPLKTIRDYGAGHLDKQGYKLLSVEGEKILEHRFVMQKFIGRKLKESEIVHHVDGNKLNNSIENLQVMDRASHAKEHHTKTFRNETHKQCTHCHKIKPRFLFSIHNDKRTKNGDGNQPRCKECVNIIQNKRMYWRECNKK